MAASSVFASILRDSRAQARGFLRMTSVGRRAPLDSEIKHPSQCRATRRSDMASSDAELAQLIEPGRVHRRVYADAAIFALEMTRIFGSAWIYVGHESQVKNPGDYFCTRIGRKPVIMVRGADGAVRVIHNQCAHRGAMVVALEHGNAPEFQCCYHGWTYHLDGRLKAVPLQHGYPREFDPAD